MAAPVPGGQAFGALDASAMPERILILRLGSMGDVLHTLPAIAALRQAAPRSYLGWVIEERWRPLLAADGEPLQGPRSERRPLVDSVHLVDTKAWRSSILSTQTLRSMRAALRQLRNEGYEAALDFQGAIKSSALGLLAGIPRRIGFRQPRERPASLFYTHLADAKGRHIIEQNVSLVSRFTGGISGVPDSGLPVDESAENRVREGLTRHGIKSFALLAPGAGWSKKQWPATRYGEVAQALAQWGIATVVNYGPGEEALAMQVVEHSAGRAQAMSSLLGDLVALTRRARLFVGGDTGPMHLAAALRVPVIAIFGPTDPARNGPYATPSIVLRDATSVTSYSHREGEHEGLLSITVDMVIDAARRLLDSTGGMNG